jgi:hypothetical protein
MIQSPEIQRLAADAVAANLPPDVVQRILSEPIVDSFGNDALRLTLVINSDAVDKITGDAALDTLAAIQTNLQKAGEERFAFVEYATEEDLLDAGDQS